MNGERDDALFDAYQADIAAMHLDVRADFGQDGFDFLGGFRGFHDQESVDNGLLTFIERSVIIYAQYRKRASTVRTMALFHLFYRL